LTLLLLACTAHRPDLAYFQQRWHRADRSGDPGLGSSAMPLVLWVLAVIFVGVHVKKSVGLTAKAGL
jgi:hypothetical protein